MTQITLPEKISFKELKDNHYQMIIEPLYPGFGVSMGNILRRVLLSSLPGGAVTSFKVAQAQHEFDSIDYVKEDLVEVMLNLKQLRLRVFSDEPVKLILEAKGEKVVKAGDITKNADVEIINKDLVIATLTDKQAKISMEITVEKGIGYQAVEMRDSKEKLEIGNIAIDANFSPILNVGFEIDYVRVGQMTNYERLTMDILTDGTASAQDAVSQSATILRDHFNLLISESPQVEAEVFEQEEAKPKKVAKKTTKKSAKS